MSRHTDTRMQNITTVALMTPNTRQKSIHRTINTGAIHIIYAFIINNKLF